MVAQPIIVPRMVKPGSAHPILSDVCIRVTSAKLHWLPVNEPPWEVRPSMQKDAEVILQ